MRPISLRHLAIAAVLLGCASTPTLRAEYALDPNEHPEGIDCFYGCLRHVDDDARRSCLWFCEGVEVTETYDPCTPSSPALCRSYAAREPMPRVEDSEDTRGGEIAADIIGTILGGLIRSAVGADDDECDDDDDDGDDDDDDRHRRSSYRQPRVSKPAAPSRGPKPWRERRERRK